MGDSTVANTSRSYEYKLMFFETIRHENFLFSSVQMHFLSQHIVKIGTQIHGGFANISLVFEAT